MTRDEVILALESEQDVSRETIDRLDHFAELLKKWNKTINLVAPSTLPDLWHRHIFDSAQLHPFIAADATTLVDLGTGGGFPGLILAILMADRVPQMGISLVESDARKCAFLQTASASLGLTVAIKINRIEVLPRLKADILTSRALAPLNVLLSFGNQHLNDGGHMVLLKGKNAESEIDEALASWAFDLRKRPSKTNAEAIVLDISNLRPR